MLRIQQKKRRGSNAEKANEDGNIHLPMQPELPNLGDRATSIAYDDDQYGPRDIKHLVLVIHGFLSLILVLDKNSVNLSNV